MIFRIYVNKGDHNLPWRVRFCDDNGVVWEQNYKSVRIEVPSETDTENKVVGHYYLKCSGDFEELPDGVLVIQDGGSHVKTVSTKSGGRNPRAFPFGQTQGAPASGDGRGQDSRVLAYSGRRDGKTKAFRDGSPWAAFGRPSVATTFQGGPEPRRHDGRPLALSPACADPALLHRYLESQILEAASRPDRDRRSTYGDLPVVHGIPKRLS